MKTLSFQICSLCSFQSTRTPIGRKTTRTLCHIHIWNLTWHLWDEYKIIQVLPQNINKICKDVRSVQIHILFYSGPVVQQCISMKAHLISQQFQRFYEVDSWPNRFQPQNYRKCSTSPLFHVLFLIYKIFKQNGLSMAKTSNRTSNSKCGFCGAPMCADKWSLGSRWDPKMWNFFMHGTVLYIYIYVLSYFQQKYVSNCMNIYIYMHISSW